MTTTFLVQFWVAASQNDRTVCPQKLPYCRDTQTKRKIRYCPREVKPLRSFFSMSSEVVRHHFMLRSWGFLCRLRFLPKVCWHSHGKWFFSTFVILDFFGPTLGHVSRHVGTCHVGVLHIKWKVLKNWCVWPPRFWKSDQNWGSYGLDNENKFSFTLVSSSIQFSS